MKVSRFVVNFVLIAVLGAVALATSVALLVPGGAHARRRRHAASGRSTFALKAQPQRSYVFDRNGDLMTTLYHQDRSPVKLANVPQQLIDAVLSIEDRKFYEHNGVDLPRHHSRAARATSTPARSSRARRPSPSS